MTTAATARTASGLPCTAPSDAGPGAGIPVLWRILKSQSEEAIQPQLAQWFAQWTPDPELAPYDIGRRIARRDREGVKKQLERRFGRYHPRHKPLIDVLMAAGQCRRMLQARSRQRLMDESRSAEARGRTL